MSRGAPAGCEETSGAEKTRRLATARARMRVERDV